MRILIIYSTGKNQDIAVSSNHKNHTERKEMKIPKRYQEITRDQSRSINTLYLLNKVSNKIYDEFRYVIEPIIYDKINEKCFIHPKLFKELLKDFPFLSESNA